jgi:hypothetical protein
MTSHLPRYFFGGPVDKSEIRKGRRFLHARQITRTSSAKNPVPEPCEVTAVRQGRVYYRNSTGFRSVTSLEKFAGEVGGWIEPEAEAGQ